MKCSEQCPALWVAGGGSYEYPDEVDCYGCMIYGMYRGDEDDHCRLSRKQIDEKLEELEAYKMGEIERPKWVAMRFVHDMDISMDLDLPQFPPKKCYPEKVADDFWGDGIYIKNMKTLYGKTDMHYAKEHAYRQGYEDCKEGKEFDIYYPRHKKDYEEGEKVEQETGIRTTGGAI